MKLQTQKISREMNCTAKVRSICTNKSMNSGVHHWNCSACTDEQVNCPVCLLWERCLKPIFPRRICNLMCWEEEKKAKQNTLVEETVSNKPKNRRSVVVCWLRVHFNSISTDDPEARCHWLPNNFLEASFGHYANYLYVRLLKDMPTHGT